MFCKSEAAFEEAKKVIPGGVDSPVRAFRCVRCFKLFGIVLQR